MGNKADPGNRDANFRTIEKQNKTKTNESFLFSSYIGWAGVSELDKKKKIDTFLKLFYFFIYRLDEHHKLYF